MISILELGSLEADASLMRLLPPEIAFRYHALPVATDGFQITVAMAAPGDRMASDAIQAALPAPLCFIQADRGEIDRQLIQLWQAPEITGTFLFLKTGLEPETFEAFSAGLVALLRGSVETIQIAPGRTEGVKLAAEIVKAQPDLVISSDQLPGRLIKKAFRAAAEKLSPLGLLTIPADWTTSVKKILLILPDQDCGSEPAVSWAGRIASGNQGQVTILPVLPHLPTCYGDFLRYDLDELLEGNDRLGSTLRSAARALTGQNVAGVYKLRCGDPLTQIREEVLAQNPDLIIYPCRYASPLQGWLTVDLGAVLFKSVSCPLLFTIQHQE